MGVKIAIIRVFMLFLVCAGTVHGATIKVATLSPDGSAWMKIMRAAGKDVAVQTENRVKFRFYPGGVMGNDEVVLRKIRIGQLQGAAVPGGALASLYPDSEVYNLPLKFLNFDEVDYVRSKMDSKIVKGFEDNGFVTFGLAEGGFAYVMSRRPIVTTKDLSGGKVWIPSNDPSALRVVQTYGVSPIPLALPDVLAGLQTGLLDTVASSPIATIALQWHTQVTHLSDIPVMYFYATLAIDKKVFKRFSPEDQATVRKIMGQAFVDIDRQNRKDNEAAYQALLNQGITLVSAEGADREEWYSVASKAEKNVIDKGYISQEMYQEFEGHLQDFRNQAGQIRVNE
ncbi:MAG: TRAP transporter substrate-binding protein DctP [Pseudomonadales bacterium]